MFRYRFAAVSFSLALVVAVLVEEVAMPAGLRMVMWTFFWLLFAAFAASGVHLFSPRLFYEFILRFAPRVEMRRARRLLVKWFGYAERSDAAWGDLTFAWYCCDAQSVAVQSRTRREDAEEGECIHLSGVDATNPLELILLLSCTEHLSVWVGDVPTAADFRQMQNAA